MANTPFVSSRHLQIPTKAQTACLSEFTGMGVVPFASSALETSCLVTEALA